MNLLEIKLENPIGNEEIISLQSQLLSADRHDYLIIDVGEHQFASMNALERFYFQLDDLEPCLMKFKKIAIVQSPRFIKDSLTPERYQFFKYKEEASNWFDNSKKF